MEVIAVLMAAGGGTRMNAKLPKTLHLLEGKPMVSYAVSAILGLRADKYRPPHPTSPPILEKKYTVSLSGLVSVVGVKAGAVKKAIEKESAKEASNPADFKLHFVKQKEQLGTGDAVSQALLYIRSKNLEPTHIIVLPSDVPNITSATLAELIRTHLSASKADPTNAATILTTQIEDSTGYGRIVHESGKLAKIVEEKDASPEERKINEINTSIYCFNLSELTEALKEVQPLNASQEYYLTDVIKILLDNGHSVGTMKISDASEVMGVNTPEEFEKAATKAATKVVEKAAEKSATTKQNQKRIN